MKVAFPKATVYQKCDASAVMPMAIFTTDGPAIFFAFEEWKLAVAFCRRNQNAGIELTPILLDRGREQFKEVFRSHCAAPGNEESFFIFNPETLWDEEVMVVNAQHLLKAEKDQVEARRCHLEWPADPLVDRGSVPDGSQLLPLRGPQPETHRQGRLFCPAAAGSEREILLHPRTLDHL